MNLRDLMHDAARSLNEYVEPEAVYDGSGTIPGNRPGDDFNDRGNWTEILEPKGWDVVRRAGDKLHWRRPGKEELGWSATTGFCRNKAGHDLLYVFSSNADPFQEMTPYSKFGAYALLYHGGDFRAASKLLGESGYGDPDPLRGVRILYTPNGHGKGNGKRAQPPVEKPEAILITLSDVQARPVEWLWRHWIPRGTLTVLDGDPGLGKSTLALDLAARVSLGKAMPPGCHADGEPAGVLLLSAEDDLANTVRPRLDAAGASPQRIHSLEGVRVSGEDRPPVLPVDLALVSDRIAEWGVKLVVIDPFTAFLGSEYDAHKDQDIRRCLHQLARLASRLDVAILLVRHLNKMNGGPALYRGGGSIGILGAARSALVVGRDPLNPDVRVLAMNKSNLGPFPKSLAYKLSPHTQDVARIEWQGETDLSPADILWHESKQPGRPDDQANDAESFLREELAGGPLPAKDLYERAEEAGIKERTVDRAKSRLGVVSRKENGRWVWDLTGR